MNLNNLNPFAAFNKKEGEHNPVAVDTTAPVFLPTMGLQFIGGKLHQLWQTSAGVSEWRKVPAIYYN